MPPGQAATRAPSLDVTDGVAYWSQLRLLVEALCSELLRFEHVRRDGVAPEAVEIKHEHALGDPARFADLRVQIPGQPAYFVEVGWGSADNDVVQSLRRKYGAGGPRVLEASKVVVIVDDVVPRRWPELEAGIRRAVPQQLAVEIWRDTDVRARIAAELKVDVPVPEPASLAQVAHRLETARGLRAFGGHDVSAYANEPLHSELLWHFGLWRLEQFRAQGLGPEEILPQGFYRGVAVVMADLCAFSSYVRDTSDENVIRDNLTAFYAKTRSQVLNDGGMFYQFVGDEVIALFGIPRSSMDAPAAALRTARNLLDIGRSVSNRWQRFIDRAQTAAGVHVGMATGDLQIVSLRPFTRVRMGAIGDAINVAARLMAVAGPSEIVVSNTLFHQLPEEAQGGFTEIEALDCHNVGRINAWRAAAPASL